MLLKVFTHIQNLMPVFRIQCYKRLFGSYGENSKIFGRIKVYVPKNISLGNNSSLNEGVFLNARTKIIIGDNVHISPYVIINTGSLDYIKKGADRQHLSNPVSICDGAWIGSGAIINPGVTIGENSVVGAGAVVTKDVPANCVAVGVPARVIKEI